MKNAVSVLIMALFICSIAKARQVSEVEMLSRLDLLPTYKQFVKVGSVSSYDRKGGNDDGFDGTYSFIRKEASGLVIADLSGPGVVTRIWTPTPSDDIIEFYFDGDDETTLDGEKNVHGTGSEDFLTAAGTMFPVAVKAAFRSR